MNEEFYISIVCEIFKGVTPLQLNGETVYLSHLSLLDQQAIDEIYQGYYSRAVSKGVPTHEEAMALQKRLGGWTDFDEQKIAATKDELDNLRATQSKLPLPSQRDSIQEQIDDAQKRLHEQEKTKIEIIGTTAESYASLRSHEQILHSHVFKDADLLSPKFSEDEFDDLDHDDIMALSQLRGELNLRFSDETVMEACLRPFFSLYLALCEDPQGFYGKPVVELTINQLKLCSFGRMFQNIFQYTDDIPENIRRSPSKLIAFSEAQRNKGKGKPLVKDDAAGSMVFGATKEDMKSVQEESGGVLLSDELKKKGGKMTMQDFIKLSGDG